MCYSTEADMDQKQIEKMWNKEFKNEFSWRPSPLLNGFTHPELPVSTMGLPGEIILMNWGLVPFWVQDAGLASIMKNRTLNAKGETVFKLASYRVPIIKRRCIIYVSGYYEWQHIQIPGAKKVEKKRYLIKLKDEPVFGLGGIYDEWTDKETGEMYTGFSVITVEANELMAEIHNSKKRMPLIFGSQAVANEWLTPLTRGQIEKSIVQLPSDRMYAEAV